MGRRSGETARQPVRPSRSEGRAEASSDRSQPRPQAMRPGQVVQVVGWAHAGVLIIAFDGGTAQQTSVGQRHNVAIARSNRSSGCRMNAACAVVGEGTGATWPRRTHGYSWTASVLGRV